MTTIISDRKLAANRENAKKSHGPVTPQGKLNSASASAKHKLLANAILIDDESRSRFAALLNSLLAEFQPRTASERIYVEKLAVAQWNTLRLWGIQSAAINREIRTLATSNPGEDAPTLAMLAVRNLSEAGRSLDVLGLQMHRYDNVYNHAMLGLRRLKKQKLPHAVGSHQSDENKVPASEIDPTPEPVDPTLHPVDPTENAVDPTP